MTNSQPVEDVSRLDESIRGWIIQSNGRCHTTEGELEDASTESGIDDEHELAIEIEEESGHEVRSDADFLPGSDLSDGETSEIECISGAEVDNPTQADNQKAVEKMKSLNKRSNTDLRVQGDRWRCEECRKDFRRLAELKRHKRFARRHRLSKEYVCAGCKRQFCRSDSMKVLPQCSAIHSNAYGRGTKRTVKH